MMEIIAALVVIALVAFMFACAKALEPRKLRRGEVTYDAGVFPMYLNAPGTRGTLSSLICAAATVHGASAVRVRESVGRVELDVVVPFMGCWPWRRRMHERNLGHLLDDIRPADVDVVGKLKLR